MKKIVFIILIFIIIIFAINSGNQKTVANNLEKSSNNEAENVILNTMVHEEQNNTLEWKTIAFIGDSLVEGYGNDDKGIDYYLKERLPNTNFVNWSKSGSTVTNNSGTDNIIMINQAKTLPENPDIIMFDGGANDIMGYALGFLNNDLKKEIGTVQINSKERLTDDTVMADFEEVIVELKQRFPNAKLCYMQLFLLDDNTIEHLTDDIQSKLEIQLRRNEFYQEMQKLCSKWEIEYLDIAGNFVGTNTNYRQDDWIHIREEGYKLFVTDIENYLKNKN